MSIISSANAPVWERRSINILIALFFFVQMNLVYNLAYIGQDFSFHAECTDKLMREPNHWFFMDTTNRPAIYLIGGYSKLFTHESYTYPLAVIICILLGLFALKIMHRSLCLCVDQPELRLAAIILLSFLPANLIAGVVYSADICTILPFACVAWTLYLSLHLSGARVFGVVLLLGLSVVVGNFVKFTFIGLPIAIVGIALIMWCWRRITLNRLLLIGVLGAFLPLTAGLALHQKIKHELATLEPRHQFNWAGTGEMTWTSLLGFKQSDLRIFDAPGYWDKGTVLGGPEMPMLEPNGYSYMALLHLGVFSDVLDFANRGSTDNGTPRPPTQKKYAKLAVRGGLAWSLIGVSGIIFLITRIVRFESDPSGRPHTIVIVWAILGLTWFSPLVLTLPFIYHVYDWGYWLPRLIIPAIWSGTLVAAWALSHFLKNKGKFLSRTILFVALIQAWWQVRSIWY